MERRRHAEAASKAFSRRSLLVASAAGAVSCLRRQPDLPVVPGARIGRREGQVLALGFVDDRYAVSADFDGAAAICLWDVLERRLVNAFPAPGPGFVLAVSPDRDYVILAGWNRQGGPRYYARVIDHRSGRELQQVDDIHLSGLAGLAVLAGNRVLAGYYDRGQPSGSLLWKLGARDPIRVYDRVADKISADGRSVLGGNEIWDVDTGAVRGARSGHKWNTGLAISSDGRSAVTRGEDRAGNRRAFLWDGRGEIRDLNDQPGMVLDAAFSGDGRFLLTGAKRKLLAPAKGLLALRDARSGRPLADLAGHLQSVLAISCSPDGRLAISADADGEIFGWTLATG